MAEHLELNKKIPLIAFGTNQAAPAGIYRRPYISLAIGGGGIIGIKGNLDISSEPAKFLEEKANWVVASPQQFIPIFGGTSRLLV